MATSKKSTGKKSKDPTSSVAATPVNLSVRLANGEEKKIRATCGLGLEKPLANYDLDTQSWKMYGDISLWGDCRLLVNLPPSGMTRNGVLFLQPAWEPITGETELSSWPTPRASSAMSVEMKTLWNNQRIATSVNGGKKLTFKRLEEEVAISMWPTPTAVTRPMEGNVRLYRAKVEAGEMTEAEAEAILGKSVWEAQGKLPATWPTPTHGKMAGGTGAFNKVQELFTQGQITDEERKSMQAGNGGKLNPTWVEWLMGFPPGWTDLED